MIPTPTTLTEVDNLPGKETPFRIGNPIWVMKSLAKLYSDTTTAVIREYSTNAMDSHIMAGRADVPIHVTLPDLMNPYFVVQDYGLGMSADDLEEIYTSFGDSMKRESRDTNGILGFGSKSAVSYTNQFTVVAVKDGMETHAIVSKRPDFSMTLKTVSVRKTDAENGVKITIPVHNREEFRAKAKNFYRFWQPGTVLVNGEEPVQAVGEKIEENLYFSANPGVSYVVMGNVGYRIENPEALFRNSNMTAISFVAYVGGGEVEHTPSREDLEYTDHTKATLQRIVDNFEMRITDTAKKQIADAETPREAYKLWRMWSAKLGYQTFAGMSYKGIKLQTSFPVENTIKYRVPSGSYAPRYNTSAAHHVDVDNADKILFVTNFNVELSSDHKRKVRVYLNEVLKRSVGSVYFMKGTVRSPWVPQENVIDWDALKDSLPKAPKRVPDPNRPKRPKGLFDFYTNKGRTYEKPIPDGADIFYVTAADAKKYSIKEALLALDADDSVVVVILASNRIEKFKRDNFLVRDFMEWARKRVVKDAGSLLTDDEKTAMSLGSNSLNWLARVDASKIDDPEWARVKALSAHRAYGVKYTKNMELARSLGMRYDVKEWRPEEKHEVLTDKYPLLSRISYGYERDKVTDEVILYLNAAYAAKKGKP